MASHSRADLASDVVRRTAKGQATLLANATRMSIMALVAAMALREIGIASEIVNLAFGLLMGAVAVDGRTDRGGMATKGHRRWKFTV